MPAFLVSVFGRIVSPKTNFYSIRVPTYVERIKTMNPLLLSRREQHTKFNRSRNINLVSIAYAIRLGLGPTNPEMITIAQESLLFRPWGFSPHLWLLIPAFSLPHAPQNLTVLLHCREERSSTTHSKLCIHVFGITFSPVTFSTQDLLTSELLRTL